MKTDKMTIITFFILPPFFDLWHNDKLSGSVLRSEAEQNRIRWSAGLCGFLYFFQ
jgi:hypothetical protein